MTLLGELGLDDNTLVIFTSDNGPHAEGGNDPDYFDSNGPLRGIKRALYEGGIRVPMIASWPSRIIAGSRSDHISAFWDVLPTLAEIAKAEVPDEIDGISFLPSLLGQDTQVDRKYLYWEIPEYRGQQAVRMGKWKGIRKDIKRGNLKIELYNLEVDPAEQYDLADDYPEVVTEIQNIMADAHKPPEVERFKMKEIGDPIADKE